MSSTKVAVSRQLLVLLLAGTAHAAPSLDLPRIDSPPMPTASAGCPPNLILDETWRPVWVGELQQQLDRIERLVTPKRQPIKRNSWVIRKFLFLHGHCQGEKISTAKCRTPVGCQVDHIQPLGCGGKDVIDNLQLLCGEALQVKNAHDIVQCRGKRGGK